MTGQIPRLIAIGGLSGTGKTALARRLIDEVPELADAVLLRSDVERKMLFGVGETDRLPEMAYSATASAAVYARLMAKARKAVAEGRPVIVDAMFSKWFERDAVAAVCPEQSAVFLVAPLDVRIARVGSRKGDASDANADIVRMQEGQDLHDVKWPKVDASGTPEDVLERVMAVIGPIAGYDPA